jgi:nucleotide-binding universal stress UspA family protein
MARTIPSAQAATTLKTIQGLLCGTDFSSNARQAADVAAVLARRLNTPLELLHATDLPAYPPQREDLHQEADRLRKQGVEVTERLLTGPAASEIVNYANARPQHWVVLSSNAKRAAQRWLLGSVSERIAERASTPTLVVRDAAPLLAWARGKQPLKVFVAFNLTATSDAALRWVRQLTAIGRCQVVVGCVDWPPDQRSRLGVPGPMALVGNPPVVQAILEREVKSRATELLGPTPFVLQIEANWGRPDSQLAEMAHEQAAQLIVVGSHQYRGFERLWHRSISRGLLHEARTNVLVVPLATRQPHPEGSIPPIRRVLVATDFSEHAALAIPHAYSMLGAGGTVRIVHVARPKERLVGIGLKGAASRQLAAQRRRRVQSCTRDLQLLIPETAAAHGILSEIEVSEHPDVAQGICQAAERFGADIICIATHRRAGLSKVLPGSVTQKVMAHSRRPILVVQPPEE